MKYTGKKIPSNRKKGSRTLTPNTRFKILEIIFSGLHQVSGVKFITFCVRRKGGRAQIDDFLRFVKIAKNAERGRGASKN